MQVNHEQKVSNRIQDLILKDISVPIAESSYMCLCPGSEAISSPLCFRGHYHIWLSTQPNVKRDNFSCESADERKFVISHPHISLHRSPMLYTQKLWLKTSIDFASADLNCQTCMEMLLLYHCPIWDFCILSWLDLRRGKSICVCLAAEQKYDNNTNQYSTKGIQ